MEKFNINIIYDEYSKFRQELHEFPEIGFDLSKTQSKLINKIKTFENYDKVVIVETIPNGFWVDVKGLGKVEGENLTIAFRSDMDALPLKETTNVPYKSKNENFAHSCGHDGHMTILTCFIEQVLLNLNKIPTNVQLRFLFQPAEEIGLGANLLISKGCLNGVDEIYGIHVVPGFSLGTAMINSGVIMASCDQFEIVIKGVGGHGSLPHLARSPITCGAEIVNKVNQIPSQRIDSKDRCVISFGSFESGNTSNVIPEQAVLTGSFRTLNLKVRDQIVEEIKLVVDGVSCLNKCNSTFEIKGNTLTVDNNKNLLKYTEDAAKKMGLKVEQVVGMASEDFSSYQAVVPGFFSFIGSDDESHNIITHNPGYDLNDKVIPIAVEFYIRTLEARLGLEII